MTRPDFSPAVLAALGAATLFGLSTPLAKLFAGELLPFLLAGLLYIGSGVGLALIRLLRDGRWTSSGLKRQEWPWLLGAVAAGGIAGPVLLMAGLAKVDAASASLMLNLEAVLTALLAWLVFRENAGSRVVAGMAAIIAGGVVLAWSGGQAPGSGPGLALIAGACLCWAIDNNLTRKVSSGDTLFIACFKGLVAGPVNLAIALVAGAAWPAASSAGWLLLIGFLGYGLSLVLFILALRGLGTARTGAYFSIAPFTGALAALAVPGAVASPQLWIAGALMALGVWLHLTENHDHTHMHESLEHAHPHVHDEHHQHAHDFPWDGSEPHVHPHRHVPITHRHAHFPDIHHQHSH